MVNDHWPLCPPPPPIQDKYILFTRHGILLIDIISEFLIPVTFSHPIFRCASSMWPLPRHNLSLHIHHVSSQDQAEIQHQHPLFKLGKCRGDWNIVHWYYSYTCLSFCQTLLCFLDSEWEIGERSSNSSQVYYIYLCANALGKIWTHHFSLAMG